MPRARRAFRSRRRRGEFRGNGWTRSMLSSKPPIRCWSAARLAGRGMLPGWAPPSGTVARNGALRCGRERRQRARRCLGAGLPSTARAWRRAPPRSHQGWADRLDPITQSQLQQLSRRGSSGAGASWKARPRPPLICSRRRLASPVPSSRSPAALLAGLQRPHAGDLDPAHRHRSARLVVVARAGAGAWEADVLEPAHDLRGARRQKSAENAIFAAPLPWTLSPGCCGHPPHPGQQRELAPVSVAVW